MNKQVLLLCLWCGPALTVPLGLGMWLLAGLLPPPSPSAAAAEIYGRYQSDIHLFRAGLLLMMVAACLIVPWVAAISVYLKRIEGRYSPMAYTQLSLGALGVLLVVFPALLLQAAAFRPDRVAEDILLVSDIAWLTFVGAFPLPLFQNIAIAVAILGYPGQTELPRWLGYFNLWVALMFVPAGFVFFFKGGPFAWDGIVGFWVGITVFGLWLFVMFAVLRSKVLSLSEI